MAATTRKIEAAVRVARPRRTYRPRRFPVPYAPFFAGFVERPRLFAFCRTEPGVRFRCSASTRVGVLDFSSFFSCALSPRVQSFPLFAGFLGAIAASSLANVSSHPMLRAALDTMRGRPWGI